MLTDSELIEKFASIHHEAWMHWASNIMITEDITPDRRKRWEGLMVPYDRLPEDMKEQDRVWARRYLSAVKEAPI